MSGTSPDNFIRISFCLKSRSALYEILALNRVYLIHPSAMTLFGELTCEPRADDLTHAIVRNHLAAQRQHISAVVLATDSRRRFVVAHRRANTRDFVGYHARPDSAAVH